MQVVLKCTTFPNLVQVLMICKFLPNFLLAFLYFLGGFVRIAKSPKNQQKKGLKTEKIKRMTIFDFFRNQYVNQVRRDRDPSPGSKNRKNASPLQARREGGGQRGTDAQRLDSKIVQMPPPPGKPGGGQNLPPSGHEN